MLLEDTDRLEKIDKLYALRLDQYVSLPMLVVVGDQSSGKSSVLEGLTGLPLPRDAGLCTRFPTQIVFKRSPNERVDVSIIPIKEPDNGKKARLARFASKSNDGLAKFDSSSFLELLCAACECMGVPVPGQDRASEGESFSHDILKIEMAGPQYEHFSVVDLPGLFRKPIPGQTTKDDMVLVRQMVSTYLDNPRSIILAVVPANVDIATQEIVQMAEDADPQRQRTLGVLTKPDLVDKGAEQRVLDLVIGSESETGLGYTVVCNRSQSELKTSMQERHTRETSFLDSPPWSDVPKERAGIEALKLRLNELLIDVTRRSFHAVSAEISGRLLQATADLEHMGRSRDTSTEQRMYLLEVASSFQSLATKAIDAYYGRDDCFRMNNGLRLATKVMAAHEIFSGLMYTHGAHRNFDVNGSLEREDEGSEDGSREGTDTPARSETLTSVNEHTSVIEFPELKQLIDKQTSWPKKEQEPVMTWITRMYQDWKGFEIGTTNPSLLPALFNEQTRSWLFYTMQHVLNVIADIHRFIHQLLTFVCQDGGVSRRIWKRLTPALCQAYFRGLEHAEFLVEVERNGNPMTLNHYFAENLKERRLARLESRLQKLKTWVTNDGEKDTLLRLKDTLDAYVTNDDHTIEDLHDTLKSYHKVARKRFVDAVCKQAIDHHLICAKHGPLWQFSPHLVGSFTEQELGHIAGEDLQSVSKRKKLVAEIESLGAGNLVLNK